MAMSAAQYLASLSPAEQSSVNATLDPANYVAALEAWYQAAIDAGDPRAVKASGGTSVSDTSEGYTGEYADFSSASDPSSWLGTRKPSPRELRKYAQMTGQSEDYARFSDAQLADWITRKWSVSDGGFLNDYGDKVEKPTESGYKSTAAGAATGESGVGAGGGYSGVGPGSAATASVATPDPYASPLQEMLMNQGGFLRQFDPNVGDSQAGVKGGLVKGGGMWWSKDPAAAVPTQPAMTAPRTGASEPVKGATPLGGTGPGYRASGLQGMMAPLQANKMQGATGLTGSLLGAGTLTPGVNSGLGNMLTGLQKKKPASTWF